MSGVSTLQCHFFFRVAELAVVVVLILGSIAGCGGSSSSGDRSPSATTVPLGRGIEEAKTGKEEAAQRAKERKEDSEAEVQSYEEEGE
jgi:hypothetical protein